MNRLRITRDQVDFQERKNASDNIVGYVWRSFRGFLPHCRKIRRLGCQLSHPLSGSKVCPQMHYRTFVRYVKPHCALKRRSKNDLRRRNQLLALGKKARLQRRVSRSVGVGNTEVYFYRPPLTPPQLHQYLEVLPQMYTRSRHHNREEPSL